jgi:type IV secretory pathway TraG/TraD family ATPase VirD4
MLAVQSIAQLGEKYNVTTRNNTLANITYKYYLMSGNSETREMFVREMGYTEITAQSTSESFAKQNNTLCGVALSHSKTKRQVMKCKFYRLIYLFIYVSHSEDIGYGYLQLDLS